jgi:CRP/FNR family transcriptional regulator
MIAKDSPSPASSRCPHDAQTSCSTCRMAQVCLPIALETGDIEQLDAIIQRGRPLQGGEHVYQSKDRFSAIYAVRSGALKAYRISNDGTEQVTGFYFPGEIFGMDGIGQSRYTSAAVALETSAICEIPFERLGELSAQIPSLQRHFFNLMSQEIAHDQQLITLISKNSAEQRIGALLLSIASRNARRRLSATTFRLPMSRIDIGNYLGLTVETISRVFNRFQKSALLKVDQREIVILQPDRLRAIVDGTRDEAHG